MPNFTRRHFFATATGLIPAAVAPPVVFGQDAGRPTFRVKVDMVVLSFTVTDSKGRYVNGLKPADFRILRGRHPAEAEHVRGRQQASAPDHG